MTTNNIKYNSIEDFRTLYTGEEKLAFFRRHISLFSSGNKDDVALEVCVEEERVNIVSLLDSLNSYIDLHLRVIQDLRFLIPFTFIKAEVLATTNIIPSQILSNDWCFSREFEIICL